MPRAAPVSVVETPEFLSATRKLLTEEERIVLVDHLAARNDFRRLTRLLVENYGRRKV